MAKVASITAPVCDLTIEYLEKKSTKPSADVGWITDPLI